MSHIIKQAAVSIEGTPFASLPHLVRVQGILRQQLGSLVVVRSSRSGGESDKPYLLTDLVGTGCGYHYRKKL